MMRPDYPAWMEDAWLREPDELEEIDMWAEVDEARDRIKEDW